jgi:hypothetical protein
MDITLETAAPAGLAVTRSLLSRMVDAITAAETQTPWPAAELADLAADVFGEGQQTRVWTISA